MTSGSEASAPRRQWRRGSLRCRAAFAGACLAGLGAPTTLCAAPPPASARDEGLTAAAGTDEETTRRAVARELAREGLALLNEERFAEAEDRLSRAFALVPAATVALLRGRALERLDRLVEATESYQTAVRIGSDPAAPPAFQEAAREAEGELSRLRPEIPRLTITLSGVAQDDPAITVSLDDEPVPPALIGVAWPIDPGKHLVLVTYRETVHDTRYVTVARGGAVKVLMRVEAADAPPLPAPPPAPPPRRPGPRRLGWVTVGVGGAGLAVGLASGIAMLGYQRELDDGCRPYCPTDLADELRGFRRTRTASAMGYGVGLLAVGLGAGIVLTAPARAPQGRRTSALVTGDGLLLTTEIW